jgi:hypothetical protein
VVPEVQHTLQKESSQLSLIRTVVSIRLFDFGMGFGLARFGEVHENLPHQCIIIRTFGIVVWVVLGRFVVARITRKVGVAFRSPPEGPSSNTSVRKALPCPYFS